jgi:hypothetical protein
VLEQSTGLVFSAFELVFDLGVVGHHTVLLVKDCPSNTEITA